MLRKFKDIGTTSIKLIFLYLFNILYKENIPNDIIEYIKSLEDFKDDV